MHTHIPTPDWDSRMPDWFSRAQTCPIPDGFTASNRFVDRLGSAHHLALGNLGFTAVSSNLVREQVGQLLHCLCSNGFMLKTWQAARCKTPKGRHTQDRDAQNWNELSAAYSTALQTGVPKQQKRVKKSWTTGRLMWNPLAALQS